MSISAEPKISVIVPVYNVEQYLERCIKSLLNQTYSNLEIILVDDGSPDNCGLICDRFAAQDNRVIVIHKKNGGVSSARNAGLDAASGEYIGFVDSDDWINADMYRSLIHDAINMNADCVCCNYQWGEYKNKDSKQSGTNACKKMYIDDRIGDGISVNVYDKLFKSETVASIRFCEKCYFAEDMLYVAIALCASRTVVKVDKTLYYYNVTPGSAMRSAYNLRRTTELIAFNSCLEFFEQNNYDPLINIIVGIIFSKYFFHWMNCYKLRDDAPYRDAMKKVKRELDSFFLQYKHILSVHDKLKYYLFGLNKTIFAIILQNRR